MVDIADERGHLHRRRMIGYWTTIVACGADLSANELRQLKQAGKKTPWTAGALLGVMWGLAITAWNTLVAPHIQSKVLSQILMFGLLPVVWLLWDVTMLRTQVRPVYAREHRRIALKLGRCPWCLYRLPRAAGKDTLTTCPECGGVWRSLEIGAASPDTLFPENPVNPAH